MGKFGKKNEISLNPLDYNICLLGIPKIGKTTILKEICEKLVGTDGYIHFDMGREDGADAIQGIVSEKIQDWNKLMEVVNDITENKESDYPDLKTIILDTLDEYILMAEKESIRLYNRKNPDKRKETINEAWGGFGKGQDKAIDLMLDVIWKLKSVGVSTIVVGHVKRKDITDPVTEETYSQLSADATQKYFKAIQNKMHFIGLAYIDREIVKEKNGKKNPVTHQEGVVNRVVSESRVISFRDDTYSIDSGSRFADIADKIPFDADEFIKALQDAISKEQAKSGESLDKAKEKQAKREKEKEEKAKEASKNIKENKIDVEKNEELIETIKTAYIAMSNEDRDKFKAEMEKRSIESFGDAEAISTKSLQELSDYISNL